MSDRQSSIRIGDVTGHGNVVGNDNVVRNDIVAVQAGIDQQLLTEVERQLVELRALIDEHEDHLDDPDTAREAVAALAQELREPEPQPPQLRMWLSAVTGAASGVSAITAAVSGVKGLLGAIF